MEGVDLILGRCFKGGYVVVVLGCGGFVKGRFYVEVGLWCLVFGDG